MSAQVIDPAKGEPVVAVVRACSLSAADSPFAISSIRRRHDPDQEKGCGQRVRGLQRSR